MKLFTKAKDGGSESPVDAFFLFEIKSICSIALLRFNPGSRENFHSHAFNAWTWFISGDLEEELYVYGFVKYKRSLLPKVTKRWNLHRVKANKTSWCFTIRGPWQKHWLEVDKHGKILVLTHGRKIVKIA